MKAVIIQKFGDLEGSTLRTGIDIPRPSEHEVLIKVKAAGVNRPDILQRQGLYKVPSDASPIMGIGGCRRDSRGWRECNKNKDRNTSVCISTRRWLRTICSNK